MPIFARITSLFLVFASSTVFAQLDTLSEMEQYKAVIRIKTWEETLDSRMSFRADLALVYLGFLSRGEQTIRNEFGLMDEEIERWAMVINTDFAQSLRTDIEPINKRFESAQSIDEMNNLLAEGEQLIFERFEKVQAQILEEIGPERLMNLRRVGLQIASHITDNNSSIIDFKAYEYLDLTEEQKKQMTALREQYLKGFEEYIKGRDEMIEQYTDLEIKWAQKGEEAVKENMEAIRAEIEIVEKKGKKVSEKFQEVLKSVQSKIGQLLTSEQTERLERIVAATPDWLKFEKKTEAATKDDAWKDSWKPGEPVPEKKGKERKFFPLKDP